VDLASSSHNASDQIVPDGQGQAEAARALANGVGWRGVRAAAAPGQALAAQVATQEWW